MRTFEIWQADVGDKREWARKIKASDTEDALEKWAHGYDNGDYTIIGGQCETVWVVEPDGVPEKWTVWGVPKAEYFSQPGTEPGW